MPRECERTVKLLYQPERESALITLEGNYQAFQSLVQVLGRSQDPGQGKRKLVRRAGKERFGLAGNDVGDFTHAVPNQVFIQLRGVFGEHLSRKICCRFVQKTEDENARFRRGKVDCDFDIAEPGMAPGSIDGLDHHLGTRHFAQRGSHGLNERLDDLILDLLANGLRAFRNSQVRLHLN